MEPLGVLVFAAIMGTCLLQYTRAMHSILTNNICMCMCIIALASVQVIQESVQVIIDGVTGSPRAIKVDEITITVLCITIGVKFCLFLFCSWVGATNGTYTISLLHLYQ